MKSIKNNSLKPVLSLLTCILFSVGGCAKASSTFVTPAGEHISTELDSFSASFRVKDGWLLGGYKVSKEGNNDPFIGFLPNDGKPAFYWPLAKGYASQFFKHDDKFYVISSAGEVMRVAKTGLSKTKFNVKPQSMLITSNPHLIACNPRGLTKLSPSNSASCYRLDGTWDVSVNWTRLDIPPAMCRDQLKVLVSSNKNKHWEVLGIDVSSGKKLTSKTMDKPEKGLSICDL